MAGFNQAAQYALRTNRIWTKRYSGEPVHRYVENFTNLRTKAGILEALGGIRKPHRFMPKR